MAESVPVRCPACRREHVYASPAYPCACGAPVAPVLDPQAVPAAVTHRTWDEDWVTVPCAACGRADQWPRPELGCPCGTVVRVPLADAGRGGGSGEGTGPGPVDDEPRTAAPGAGATAGAGVCAGADPPGTPGEPPASGTARADDRDCGSGGDLTDGTRPGGPGTGADGNAPGAAGTSDTSPGGTDRGQDRSRHTEQDASRRPHPAPRRERLPAALPLTGPASRAAFQPVTIRTARDAVTAAALYLRRLGYRDIRRADRRPPSGISLAARGIVAQVDPTVRPVSLRDVECLWLTAMTESAGCACFSLAGYQKDARTCADSLGVALFVLDLTGTPQPANSLADGLVASGA